MKELLNVIDSIFNNKSYNEKVVYILIISMILPYIIYIYILPDLEKAMRYEIKMKHNINAKVLKNKKYLESVKINNDKQFYIKKYNLDIEDVKKQIRIINDNREFIDKELNHLSELLFHRDNWSKFLNNISNDAKRTDVTLINIKNKYIDVNNSNFGHVLNITIKCTGTYNKLINFFNRLEKNILITDIYETKLSVFGDGEYILANIKLSIWGIHV